MNRYLSSFFMVHVSNLAAAQFAVFLTVMVALLTTASANANGILFLYVDPPRIASTAAHGVTSTCSGPGTYQLFALDTSTTDFGIQSFDIGILGVTSILDRSPVTQVSDPDHTNLRLGFSLLRESTTTEIEAEQPLPTNFGYMVRGFGQTAGNFAAVAMAANPAASIVGPTTSSSWGDYNSSYLLPSMWNGKHWLFLAEGTYSGVKPTSSSIVPFAITVFTDKNFTAGVSYFSVTSMTGGGDLFDPPVFPEPASVVLAGVGLVGFVGARFYNAGRRGTEQGTFCVLKWVNNLAAMPCDCEMGSAQR